MIGIRQDTMFYHPELKQLVATVKVEDETIRAQKPGFDGMEKPFVLLPREDGSWERFNAGAGSPRTVHSHPTYDLYQIVIPDISAGDVEAIRENGAAVGVESNVGTLWGQEPGHNNHSVEPMYTR